MRPLVPPGARLAQITSRLPVDTGGRVVLSSGKRQFACVRNLPRVRRTAPEASLETWSSGKEWIPGNCVEAFRKWSAQEGWHGCGMALRSGPDQTRGSDMGKDLARSERPMPLFRNKTKMARMAVGIGAALCLIHPSSPASAADLILNGGFESGIFGAWNTASRAPAVAYFAIDSNALTDLNGLPTPGPALGSYYVVSDQAAPASFILWQVFNVPADSSVSISYQIFANSYAPVAIGAGNLNHSDINPNQHARVDVISLADFMSDNYRTSGSIINLWTGGSQITAGDPSTPWMSMTHDVTGFTGAGGMFVLRYGVTANQEVFNLGVDGVSIEATSIPESQTAFAAMMVAVCGMLRILQCRSRQGI